MDGRVALLAWLVVRAAGALPGNKALQERHQAVDRLLAGLAPQGLNVSDAKLIHEFCDQKLDHFDDSNGHTWCQRFAVEAKYYKKGGPVFLCLDGEDFPWMHHSALSHLRTCNNMVQLAPRFNAMLLCLEHRYYGGAAFDGVPSFQKEHLRFLSSRQALRDAVAFQSYAEQRLELTGPWIAFGGSYSGALAAWARKLYPKSFFAAVSSSAPIQNQLQFKGYHDVVASNLASASLGGSVECLRIVASGHRSLGRLAASELGRRLLESKFKLCGHRVLEDADNLAGWAGFGVIVSNQYNSDRCEVTSCNVRLLCGNLTEIRQKVENDLDALMLMNDYQRQELVAKGTALSECQDVSWGHYLDGLKVTEKRSDSSNQMGLWTYQICTEFGNFMTCEEGSNCPWTQGFLGMKLWFDMCDYAFGITKAEVEAKVAETNRHYGGTAFEATRVVFTNGAADPWHWLSVLVHPHQDVETLFVQGASHCQWMQAPWASMPEQHRAVQLAIQNKIAQWLQA